MAHYFNGHQCFGTKGNPKSENIKDIVNDHNLTSPVYVGDYHGRLQCRDRSWRTIYFLQIWLWRS